MQNKCIFIFTNFLFRYGNSNRDYNLSKDDMQWENQRGVFVCIRMNVAEEQCLKSIQSNYANG